MLVVVVELYNPTVRQTNSPVSSLAVLLPCQYYVQPNTPHTLEATGNSYNRGYHWTLLTVLGAGLDVSVSSHGQSSRPVEVTDWRDCGLLPPPAVFIELGT